MIASLNCRIVLLLLWPVLPVISASEGFAQPATDHTDNVFPDRQEISDSEAEEMVRQQVAAREALEQSDRAKAAQMRLLQRTAINLGDHRLIRHQAVPPILPEVTNNPSPAGIDESSEDAVGWEEFAEKASQTIALSATVYDRRVTHLRWQYGGRSYSAWSSIDLNFLRGVTGFETSDTHYFVFMGIGDAIETEFDGEKATPKPKLPQFPPGAATYSLENPAEAKAHPAALAGSKRLGGHPVLFKTPYMPALGALKGTGCGWHAAWRRLREALPT